MYERLERISELIREAVETGFIAGANAMVLYKGKPVYSGSFGYADKEKGTPMTEDTIFRMYSMSKPVTAAAAMILMERGMLDLRSPLKWYIPEFENPMVLDENGTRPAGRDIIITDLLSMTSGICYPDDTPAGRKMGELWYQASEGIKPLETVGFAKEMGRMPLAFTPGEKWMYGASADIMGALVEIISGMKYGDFLEKEIFAPLGMKDTGFMIPEEKYHRLSRLYRMIGDWNTGELTATDESILNITDYKKPPLFESGGAGLTSTIGDYSRFAQMILNGGELDGVRILGRKTVDFMTENQLDEPQLASLNWDSMRGYGYGNFMRILRDKKAAGCNSTLGECGWDGWTGNSVFMDRAEDLAFLFFIQRTDMGAGDLLFRLKNVVYSAI